MTDPMPTKPSSIVVASKEGLAHLAPMNHAKEYIPALHRVSRNDRTMMKAAAASIVSSMDVSAGEAIHRLEEMPSYIPSNFDAATKHASVVARIQRAEVQVRAPCL